MVVHPHLHFRRTGATQHVEAVVSALADAGARTFGMSLRQGLSRIGLGELFAAARREPLVWHAHRNNELLLGYLVRLIGKDVRVVYTRHSATRPSAYTRWLMARADRIISLTRQVNELLGGGTSVIGHGVDLTRFHPPEDRAAAWRALGVGGERGVGVIGRVRPAKGQKDFVDAVRPLLAEHPDWRAVLVGRVKPGERGFAKALEAGGEGRLAFVEEQPDVAPWYRGLSVVVQPSHSEGFSLVLLEAMASGCCVVASSLPHFPELIEHERTGFLYPVGDVAALRSLLTRLFENPHLAHEVGERAAAEAKRRFGLEHEAKALWAVYQQAHAPALPRSSEGVE